MAQNRDQNEMKLVWMIIFAACAYGFAGIVVSILLLVLKG